MKSIKFVSVFFLVLAIGIIPVPITASNKNNPKTSDQKFVRDARHAIRKAFRNEGVKKFVDEDLKSTVFVTFRVDKNRQLKVLKIENCGDEISNLIKKVISEDYITLNESCKYRQFRVPITFVYKE